MVNKQNLEKKYFTKFSSEILDAKIGLNELGNKSDISNLVKKSAFNTKLSAVVTKTELKAEQDEVVRLQTFKLFSRQK